MIEKNFVIKKEKYSKGVLGYRVVICGKPHYILNGAFSPLQRFRILLKLKQLRKTYRGNEFILLHNDFEVHVAPDNYYEYTKEKDAI